MAHEIEIVNNVARMAYVQETVGTPWHGLGIPVAKGISREEMLHQAGLDHEIQKRRLYVRASEVVGSGLYNIPKQFAVMRKTDNQFYGTVSDRYQVVQNREVMDFFADYVDAGGMELATAGSLKDGGVIWVMARIGKDFTLAGGDKVEGNLTLANSHDGSMSYIGMINDVDVVCMNTLSISISTSLEVEKNGANKMFKMKHSKKMTAEIMQDAKEKLGLAAKKFDRLKMWCQALSQQKVKDPQHVIEFVAELTSPELLQIPADWLIPTPGSPKRDKVAVAAKNIKVDDLNRAGKAIMGCILDSPGQQLEARLGTWWGVLNGVTRYVDHEAGRGRDTALQSAWFGSGNSMKQQAAGLVAGYAKR